MMNRVGATKSLQGVKCFHKRCKEWMKGESKEKLIQKGNSGNVNYIIYNICKGKI